MRRREVESASMESDNVLEIARLHRNFGFDDSNFFFVTYFGIFGSS